MPIIYIILAIIAIVIIWFIAVYNSFILARNRTKEALSDIDVQLKRRFDLIPNLVETVKGYAGHEKELFEKVTLARSQAISAQGFEEKAKAENMLSNTLKSLFAVSENYPDLKANANFLDLQRELADTENKIQASRRFYNGNAMAFNTRVESFPSNIIAGIFKFKKIDFFEAKEQEKENIKVKF